MNQPELARPTRPRRAHRIRSAAERVTAARVTVSWIASPHTDAESLAPTELELVAGLESASDRTWTCLQGFGSNWVEAISAARCTEVVLTARLGDDTPAKHLVLELAELLTFKLTQSQPLIRVLFLPPVLAPAGAPHGVRTHA